MKFDFEACIKSGVDQAMKECELTIGMTLKEAVEKRIPKKPKKINEEYINGEWRTEVECPSCGNPYVEDSFCPCCGQALDWSDVE